MKRGSKISYILVFLLCLALILQGPVMAEVVVDRSVPIRVRAKVTTHPDSYNTQISLHMLSPVVSDLDNDCVLDVIGVGFNPNTQKSYIYLWNRDGFLKKDWPKEINGKVENSPAVGDLDNDGDLEIVLSVVKNPPDTGGWIYIWHHDGNINPGYPKKLDDYTPSPPVIGDVSGGFEEEALIYESNIEVAVCDIDLDGKKEIIKATNSKIRIENGDATVVPGWDKELDGVIAVGRPVAGDTDGDGRPEVFLAVQRQDGNFIYGWYSNGEELAGWPINIAGVNNTNGDFVSLGDIDRDGVAEIITGSNNGYIAGWYLNGGVAFSSKPSDSAVYQPIIGDIDNDGDMEVLATSKDGNIYGYGHNGTQIEGWPIAVNYELAPGGILVDIDSDSLGDPVNPANDLEFLFGTSDGQIHSIDLPGDFDPNKIQWGMYGFNPRNTDNYLRDWNTDGWFVFDNKPEDATITSVYDWVRGSRVIEFDGAGLNNSYTYRRADGRSLNSKDTTFQWAMKYTQPFIVYVSIDTILGKRYLYYTATDGNQPMEGDYIHHGLGGDADNGRWHTFSRNLVQDLKDAEPSNEIIDINAVYVQGSGRVDDIMLFPGDTCPVDLVNLAPEASIEVSSGDDSKVFINDGDPDTKWVSGNEDLPRVEYTWEEPQKVNKILIQAVDGAKSGVLFIIDSKGNVYKIPFTVPSDGGPFEIPFRTFDDVKSIVIVFYNEDGKEVKVGEIEVYYDPCVEIGTLFEIEYSSDSYIKIKDGYFYDPVKKDYWIPHGIAYQTWNKALGQWQSHAELKRDLDMMVEVGANVLRVDFVWKHIEVEDVVYDWSRYDMLLEEAQARGIKVFPIIGYQWPPDWFLDEWYTMYPPDSDHPEGPWKSDILSYEDDDVLREFSDFLQAVVSRYSVKGEREDLGDTIAGWILGNEYGYLELWRGKGKYDGYDPDCQDAFREWLEGEYGFIDALNTQWVQDNVKTPGYLPNHPYEDFDEVDMPIPFGYKEETIGKYLGRDKASWYDLTQWREESIAKFVALAAKAVRDKDPGHLITYAAVGMQWGEEDWRYHTEDAKKIAKACHEIKAPLNFWSINNYPWGLENSDLMTGQWGIERARHDTGLPVMVTETGFTSVETMYPGMDEDRQARLTRNAIWEALESGAIGVCVFHWNDRGNPWLTERERGFGIVTAEKEFKPAYFTVKEAFMQMDEIDIGQYLKGSADPERDIAFLWDDAVDTIVNRYEAEMKELFGTLERLGYEPTFIDDEELLKGVYKKYKAIVLPRNQKMFDSTFGKLNDINIDDVKIHANCDIPGIMNEYAELRDKDEWVLMIRDVFGIDVTDVQVDPNLEDEEYFSGYETSSFELKYKPKTLSYPAIWSINKTINMWKYRDETAADGGIVIATFDSEDGNPALVFHFETAISLFSLGDNQPIDNAKYDDWTWADRYDWMKTIYMDPEGFGIPPRLIVSNKHILADYRITEGGSVLLSLKNYRPNTEETTTVTTDLIFGKTIKDLLTDETVEDPSDGVILRTLQPDGHDLLLAYSSGSNDDDDDGDDADDGDGEDKDNTDDGDEGDSGGDGQGNQQENQQNQQSSKDNQQQNDQQEDDAGDSSQVIGGPATVIILGEDRGRDTKIDEVTKSTEQKLEVVRPSRKRTYEGSEHLHEKAQISESSEPVYPEKSDLEKLSPLEQFREAVNESVYKEPGIIRVEPRKVSPEKLKEIIKKPILEQKPTLPLGAIKLINDWILKLKSWWQELLKSVHITFKKTASTIYVAMKLHISTKKSS